MKENKHVEKFKSNHLNAGESVVAWGPGYMGKFLGSGKDAEISGVLIVTNTRVAFYRKDIINEILETIPLKQISAIERKATFFHRLLRIHTAHDDLEFKTFNKEGEQALAEAIEAGRNANTGNVETPVGATGSDPYDQLKKLAELKNAGVITEEEFQDKKNKLMELM